MRTNNKETIRKLSEPLAASLAQFLDELTARSVSPLTLLSYRADVRGCLAFIVATNGTVATPADIRRPDLIEYFASLASQGLSGVYRARKRAAIRAYFQALVDSDAIATSPAASLPSPKQETRPRRFLEPAEYRAILAAAGPNPRDFCLFTVFLQTGIRLAELCGLTLDDVDFEAKTLTVTGKGQKTRVIPLERKAIAALRTYTRARPWSPTRMLFLNRYGEPLSERGVRKLVTAYVTKAGLDKPASPHAFRHTFGTMKARSGLTAYQLQPLMGHAFSKTTDIYVHMGSQDTARIMEQTSL